MGSSTEGETAGSDAAVIAVCGRSHEHLSTEVSVAVSTGMLSTTFCSGVSVSGGCSSEQHFFRFAFVGLSSPESALSFGNGVGADFREQQRPAALSVIGHAHDAGAQPLVPAWVPAHVAAKAGATTAGITWPSKAKTAKVNRKVVDWVNNAESRKDADMKIRIRQRESSVVRFNRNDTRRSERSQPLRPDRDLRYILCDFPLTALRRELR